MRPTQELLTRISDVTRNFNVKISPKDCKATGCKPPRLLPGRSVRELALRAPQRLHVVGLGRQLIHDDNQQETLWEL